MESGRLEEMIADFAEAECPSDTSDLARLGKTWSFGRACGKPVEYSEIRKLQVQTLKSDGMPLETTLYAVLNSGMSVPVCREIRKSKAGKDISATKEAIRSKLSSVQQV